MRKTFSCGHKGLGKHCHRCSFVELLEQMIKDGKRLVTHKKAKPPAKPKRWTLEEMQEEVKRLQRVY